MLECHHCVSSRPHPKMWVELTFQTSCICSSETHWPIVTKLHRHVHYGSRKRSSEFGATASQGGAITSKKVLRSQRLSDWHENWLVATMCCPGSGSMRLMSYSKKHGRHWPIRFQQVFDSLKIGQSPQNLIDISRYGLSTTLWSMTDISHWGVLLMFSNSKMSLSLIPYRQ